MLHCIPLYLYSKILYLLYDPAILLLGIYLKEMKTYVQIKIYMVQMFIRSLFLLIKNKLSRCLSRVDSSVRDQRMNWEIFLLQFYGRDCVELVFFFLYMFCRIYSEASWAWNFLCRKIFTEIKFLRYRTIWVIYFFKSFGSLSLSRNLSTFSMW